MRVDTTGNSVFLLQPKIARARRMFVMIASDDVEMMVDELVRMNRPGAVVLVDREIFPPLLDVLRSREQTLQVALRTASFRDPVALLMQALISPCPAMACFPSNGDHSDDEALRKAHMVLDQLGIRVIEGLGDHRPGDRAVFDRSGLHSHASAA